MNLYEYNEMHRLESFYWWFVARRKLLDSIIKKISRRTAITLMLDVGCGTGINSLVLASYGATISSDASQEALRLSRSRGLSELVRSRVERLPFAESSFDVVTALDMLEHVDDDLAALDELWRVTREAGLLVITVPAYGFLWSEHDEALHHRRRYAASELRNKLARAGFQVQQMSYYITSLFFPILVMRFMQSIFKKSIEPKTSHIILPDWMNSLLIRLLDVERFLLRYVNFPFGVSLICVASKAARPERHSASRLAAQPVRAASAEELEVACAGREADMPYKGLKQ